MSADARPRVLIVDDDEGLASVIQLMLDRAGYATQVEASGLDALQWLAGNEAAAVVLDLMMPDIDGFQFLQQLRAAEVTRDLPVIVLTARTDDKTRRDCAAAGATAFLTKPVGRSVLVDQVRAAIRRGPLAL